MFSWAITFLIVAIIAAVLGFSGVAGAATNIAWLCAILGLVFAVLMAIKRRV